ncbi:MAG: DUF1549 domain-containing protein [Planctomycetaceae bacterium]
MRWLKWISLPVLGLLLSAVVQTAGSVEAPLSPPAAVPADQQLDTAVAQLNQYFQQRWQQAGLQPAVQADELTVFRRVSLALFGCVPALAEIKAFQQDQQPNRLDRWIVRMLQDDRFGRYFADRLARSLTGVEQGPLFIFRRDRLRDWLAEQLLADASWGRMTRDLIAAEGLWTDQPAANFITIARLENEELDEVKLAGRTARAFLGQRIDCAQCHDHPFDPQWKQRHFEGLAAWYCQATVSLAGVTDFDRDKNQLPVVYKVAEPGKDQQSGRTVDPAVPFNEDWLPATGSLRSRLATWVTHPDNRRFERAIANRIWGLMVGRPLLDPVDDLPHPEDSAPPDALDLLGAEFRRRGEKLSVLIRLIALSQPWQLSSESPEQDLQLLRQQQDHWAVFPLVRLRPEQVIGSLFQAGRVRMVDQNSHPLIRFQKLTSENDFIQEYGDAGEDELNAQSGTITQSLLKMNGRFTADSLKVDLLSGPAELLQLSPDDATIIENSFLMCLTRRPSAEEQQYFLEQLKDNRNQAVEDLFWALFNSPEFSWNH